MSATEDRTKTKATMKWDWGNGPQERPINLTLDIRDFEGTAGYAWVFLAANPHLSAADIWRWLLMKGNGMARSESWIQRRRWLFLPRGTINSRSKPNRDGKDEKAITLMAEHTRLSLRDVVRLLAQHGIKRGKDWVRKHRVDGVELSVRSP